MALVARGTFASSNLAFQGENVMLSFPAATDKNQDNLSYSIQYTTQPIYCNTIGESYICSESTDEVVVSSWENITAFTEDGGIISTVRAMPTFSTDVVLKFVIRATDSIMGGGDEPTKTSGDIYLVRNASPALQMRKIDWTAEENIIANGVISNLGTTCPANYTTIANTAAWTNWRAGIVTALGGNITFTYKYSYSIDNISYSTPAVVNASYNFNLTYDWLQNRNFALTINNSSGIFDSSNSYYIKIYLVSSMYTVSSGLNPATLPQLLLNRMPVFNMKKGVVKVNIPQKDIAKTGAIMAARGPQQDVTDGQSLALYDLHTESGQSEVANSPSIGFFDNLHNLMAKVGINYNISTDTGDIEITNLLTNGNIILTPNGTGVVKIGTTPLILIPDLTGNSGKFLTTNGTTVSWASVDALPSQTGNSGKFLTTNGTVASWATVDVSGYVPLSGATYIQASGYSGNWGETNGISTGAFNAIMGVGSGATWLLSGTSGGLFRGGIQLLNAGGEMRFYLDLNCYLLTGDSGTIYHSGNFNPGDYLPLSGGTMTGTITNNIVDGADRNILYGTIGTNSQYRIRAGGTNNAGWLEIATADGVGPIYFRQYLSETIVGWACIDANHSFVSSHDFYAHSGYARCWDTYDFYFQTS